MKRFAVIGAGTMGHGIAHAAALAGYDTTLTDARRDALVPALARVRANLDGGVQRGKLSAAEADAAFARLTTADSVAEATRDADVVVEAVVEDLNVKRELFTELDALVSDNTLLATNTSSLSVKAIAEVSAHPGRVLGLHFFNPVHIMKLVEVVTHDRTADDAVERARAIATAMDKVPIVVKDRPGFASSRLGVVLGLEAMRMVEEGVASAEDIDTAMQLGYGHPMGPLKVSDLVGLDVRLAIADYLERALGDARYAAPAILRRKVEAGDLGKKSGRGFYEWPTTSSSSTSTDT
jgi:3-hydroxybutyryl-CoA dehydrogenase